MQIDTIDMSGPLVITPKRHEDHRGFFSEIFRLSALEEAAGCALSFVQDNLSLTRTAGTIRGLHFQAPPHAQGKLVRCARGRIIDVAVDIRGGSPTFGQWHAEELSGDNGRQFWIPPGFAHGFRTLTPDCEVAYKCTAYYAPGFDRAIAWDDPDIGVDWGPGLDRPILSDKDKNAPRLSSLAPLFTMNETRP